jgi:hypothetical protein
MSFLKDNYMEEIDSTENIQVDSSEETKVQKTDTSQTQHVPDILVNEKAVVTTDNLNIRNLPSLDGTIIDNIYFGNVVTIYAIRDYKNTINGEYNCWYKLSNTEEIWANALYIKRFPFFINSDEYIDWSHVFYEYPSRAIIKINNFNEFNGKYYFTIIHGYSDEPNELDVEMNTMISIDDIHFTILNNNYDNLYKIVNENIYKINEKLFPTITYDEYLASGGIYEKLGYKAFYSYINPAYGGFIKKLEIKDKEERFICGLRLGEKRSYLEKIFGFPTEIKYDKSDNIIFSYSLFNDEFVRFKIENDEITIIEWEFYQ